VSLRIVVLLVRVILVDRVAVLRGVRQLHVAAEEARQDGIDIGCVAQHHGAVRELDPHRWKLLARSRRVDKCRTAPKQAGPQLRVLRARELAGLPVSERVSAVTDNPTFTHVEHVELLAQHRLDGIPPQRPNRANPLARVHCFPPVGPASA